tara:strand:- start:916 stop:1941 length:1026 start_codon:yes stop_codon:yes gene_type:complete
MKRPLRTVVIGFGNVADRLSDDHLMGRFFQFATHAQVLSKHPAFSWEAVVDPSDDALNRARKRWNIPHTTHNIEELNDVFVPEVAVIATPPTSRLSILSSLPKLRAAIVEKPLAMSSSNADSFVNLCSQMDIPVQVNYWRRGVEAFQRLAAGELQDWVGEPQAIFSTYGSGLFNNGSHIVDFIRMLFGEIVQVQSIGKRTTVLSYEKEKDIDLPISLTLEDGATAVCLPLDFKRYREVGIDIWGDAGRISILQESLSLTKYKSNPNRALTGSYEITSDAGETNPILVENALYKLYDNLAAAVADGTPLLSPISSALRTENILNAGLLSENEGQRPIVISPH